MRTYSESEVADIIARAAERLAEAAREPTRDGLTLDEIERLGREAGLDPSDLRAAAAEIDAAGRTLLRQTAQTRTQLVVERWLDGPLTQGGWEDAVAVAENVLGADMAAAFGMTTGGQTQVGQAFEWTHMSGLGVQTKVLASPRGERTKLRLTQLVGFSSPAVEGATLGSLVGLLLAGIVLASLTASGVAGGAAALAALVAFVLATAVAIPLATTWDRRWRGKKLDALGALADQIAPLLVTADPSAADTHTAEALSAETEPLVADGPAQAPLRDAFEALGDESDTEALGAGPLAVRHRGPTR